MRDRTATRFGSCITPLVLGAVQFSFSMAAPWAFVQDAHPHTHPSAQRQGAIQTPAGHAAARKPHLLPPPVVRDIVKSATKLPALSTEDAFEDSLPALTETFVAAE